MPTNALPTAQLVPSSIVTIQEILLKLSVSQSSHLRN